MYVFVIVAVCACIEPSEGAGSHATDVASVTTSNTTNKYYDTLVESLPSQHGRCIAITGTTSGLGYWTAIATVSKSPSCLIMLNRASSKGAKAEEEVKRNAPKGVSVFSVTCDLENITSVREAAAHVNRIAASFGGLDVLALNAGIMAQPDQRTADGFDVTMQTNHLSHFLLTKLVMPSLHSAAKSRGEVRIVTQTSLARGGDAPNATYYMQSPPGTLGGDSMGMERYHQSKLANIVFSMALHSKFSKANGYSNFKALSAAPGIAATDLNFPGRDKIPKAMLDWLQKHMPSGVIQSAPDGSCSLLTAMYVAAAESGDFYEPKWLAFGPPAQVIAQGIPDKLASVTRTLIGVKDSAICGDEFASQMWKDSEAGLGEKFIIEESPAIVV